MDMHSLIHHAPPSSSSSSTSVAPASETTLRFAGSAPLPGLRAHFPSSSAPPSLPIRLPVFRPTPPPDCSAVAPLVAPQDLRNAPLNAPSSTTTLAPLRFIIPTSHCSPSSVATRGYSSGAATGAESVETAPAVKVEHAQPFGPVKTSSAESAVQQSSGESSSESHALSSETLDAKAVEKKPAPKRSRVVKNANRSTKSKARPGLRKGKWTDEESKYATQLTHYFKEGLLPIERGTMLRLYLSQKLNCEPMRITKKFTGVECIGKQVFRPCSPTPESRVRLMQAQLELVALEAAFIKKVKENHEEAPGSSGSSSDEADNSSLLQLSRQALPETTHVISSGNTSSSSSHSTDEDEGFTSDSSSASSPCARVSSSSSILKKPQGDEAVDSANAVGLLLDFFYKANSRKDEAMTAPTVECATSGSDSDSVANSPTKRIRALSISAYDSAFAKRSRATYSSS